METNRSLTTERNISVPLSTRSKILTMHSRQKITVKTQIPEGTKAIDRPSQEEALKSNLSSHLRHDRQNYTYGATFHVAYWFNLHIANAPV